MVEDFKGSLLTPDDEPIACPSPCVDIHIQARATAEEDPGFAGVLLLLAVGGIRRTRTKIA